MDFTKISLSTLIPQIPKIVNDNFSTMSNYMDIFYDSSAGILIKPITTTGRIKGTTGEFVNVTVDNLTVKKQYTNLYSSISTADYQWYTAYNGAPTYGRVYDSSAALPDPCTGYWPAEDASYRYIDISKPYYKIYNDVSIAFTNNVLSQIVEILFETSTGSLSPYTVRLDPSHNMVIPHIDASTSVQLMCVGYDASYGPTWIIKQFSGSSYPSIVSASFTGSSW